PPVVLMVGMDRSSLDATLRIIGLGLLVAAALVTGGAVVAVRSSIATALAPLDALSSRVGQIGEDSLSTRLQEPDLPAELLPIQSRLNALLARLDEAFAREQRFTAAAAHELRTPVAELRSLLEVALDRPRSVA